MARPRTTTNEQRHQIIDLKRRNSFAEVAKLTGLALGTVKTICRRSGAFADNPEHRALFILPEPLISTETNIAAVQLPPQRNVSGDKDLDAFLWLREMIETGNPT